MDQNTNLDAGFSVNVEGLIPKTIYKINQSVFSGMENFFEKDAARLICSLQGLINRDFEKNGNILVYMNLGELDEFWLNYMMSDGKSFSGFNVKDINTLDEYFSTFGNAVSRCGLITWDEQIPATANVAATVCGLEGKLPVKFCDEPDSFYTYLVSRGFEVKQSLVGLFGEGGSAYNDGFKTCGSAKNDAYIWAMDKYFDRCSSKYIAYVLDGAGSSRTSPCQRVVDAPSVFCNCIYNHDYYIARRCFFFDLTCYGEEAPIDDPDQPIGTDRKTFIEILRRRYKNAGGEIGQLLGFPPWWMKYTKDSGTGSVQATVLEWDCVMLGTAFNLAKEADAAQPCSMDNASAYCNYKSSFEKYTCNRPKEKLKFDPKTKYFTIYAGDYDSAAWLRQHVYTFFSKENSRGSIPIDWAFNPNLSERAPMVFDYIHEHETDNDFFVAGDSGAGYVIPYGLTSACEYRESPPALDKWVEYSKPFYDRFDLEITGFIINGHETVTNEVMDAFNKLSPKGSFHNSLKRPLTVYNGVPYMYLHNEVVGKPERVEASIPVMLEHMNGFMKGTNFAAYRSICDSPDDTKRLVDGFIKYAKEKCPEYDYKYVDFYTFFDLVLQSGQGEIINE